MAGEAELKAWKPFHCQFCGDRYHRRDYHETWTLTRNARTGDLVYIKVKLRCCIPCAAQRRHERFVRGPDPKLLIGKTVR